MAEAKTVQPRSALSAMLWNLVFITVVALFLGWLGAAAWEAVTCSLGLILLYDIKLHLLGILQFTYLNRLDNVRKRDEKSE